MSIHIEAANIRASNESVFILNRMIEGDKEDSRVMLELALIALDRAWMEKEFGTVKRSQESC
jgi:hypothetical protein